MVVDRTTSGMKSDELVNKVLYMCRSVVVVKRHPG